MKKTQSIIACCIISIVFFNTAIAHEMKDSTSIDSIQKKKLLSFKTPAEATFIQPNTEKMFKPVVSLESWLTYSMGEKKGEVEYADRTDASFRRFRFGGCGNPYSWLQYSFQLHLDRLGEDAFAATKGSDGGLGLWNAYITAKPFEKCDLLYIHAGYYWAAISREFNTSPWAIGSFDKTRADWYLRNFTTGKGNGIESGIGFGGLKNFEKFGISYRLGMYEPDLYTNSEYASRLYTARLMFSIGNPEQIKYKYMLSGNQWRKRNGVTIGFGASSQSNGKIDDNLYFDKSSAFGTDIIINYRGLRIDGEAFIMNRNISTYDDFEGTEWHVRVGYSLVIAGKYIEPIMMYEQYEGKGDKTVFKYIGDDKTLDCGINWYLNKDKLKLALHYIVQQGTVSSNTGEYFGMACQVKL